MNSHIKINKKLRLSALAASVFLFVFAGLAVFPVANSMDDTLAAGPKQSETSLTISADDLTLNFDIDSVDGSFAEDSASVSVVTNNITGYTLSINTGNTGDNAGKLVGENQSFNPISGATSVADFTDSADYNGLWGYKPSKINSATNTSYLPAPTETTTIEETNAPNAEANVYEIGLGARADLSYEADSYTNTFVITGVANPVGYVIAYNKNTDDTVTNMPATQSDVTMDTVIALADNTPVRAEYDFLGWCDGVASGTECTGTIYQPGDNYDIYQTAANNTTLYALWVQLHDITVNYHNGENTNVVVYSCYESSRPITKYSHTPNVADDGIQDGGYGDDVSTNEVITIPDASSLHVTLTYQTESTDYDWVSMWEGSHPDYTASNDYDKGIKTNGNTTGKYGDDTEETIEFDVLGNSITIGFESDGSQSDYYGYYAIVTSETSTVCLDTPKSGSYVAPAIREGYDSGWSDVDDTTSIKYLDEESVKGSLSLDVVIVNKYIVYVERRAVLDSGRNVNGKLKSLSGQGDYVDHENNKIKQIVSANSLPNGFTPTRDNDISASDSSCPIYAWFDDTNNDGIIYVYSPMQIYMNANSEFMFSNLRKLTNISALSDWDTSGVANMYSMFDLNTSLVNINALSNWDTSKVTNMSAMFYYASSLTNIDALSNWDTSNVTNMSAMFCRAFSLANIDGASDWDTSSVIDMNSMFYYASSLANLNALTTGQRTGKDYVSWDTSNVIDMSYMLSAHSLTNIDGVSNWDTSSVTNMNHMFQSIQVTDIDALATVQHTGKDYVSWDTSNVTDMSYMFAGSSIVNIDGASNWDTSSVTDMNRMFDSASSLININGASNWDTSNVTNMYDMFRATSSLANINGASNWDTSNVTNMGGMFESASSLINIDALATVQHTGKDYISWDTSNVTNMGYMFYYASSLTNIDGASNWDTSSVTNMNSMFKDAISFTNINGASNWDTSSVTDMSYMFSHVSSLSDISGVAGWNVPKVTDMSYMFDGATSLTDSDDLAPLNNWTVNSSLNKTDMFYNIPSNVIRPTWYE